MDRSDWKTRRLPCRVVADRKLTQVFYLSCLIFRQEIKKVITMDMLGKIRRMFLRDKLSLHEITKRTGLSRNTIRRWLRAAAQETPPTYRRAKGPGKLTEFHAALEQALKVDGVA